MVDWISFGQFRSTKEKKWSRGQIWDTNVLVYYTSSRAKASLRRATPFLIMFCWRYNCCPTSGWCNMSYTKRLNIAVLSIILTWDMRSSRVRQGSKCLHNLSLTLILKENWSLLKNQKKNWVTPWPGHQFLCLLWNWWARGKAFSLLQQLTQHKEDTGDAAYFGFCVMFEQEVTRCLSRLS